MSKNQNERLAIIISAILIIAALISLIYGFYFDEEAIIELGGLFIITFVVEGIWLYSLKE